MLLLLLQLIFSYYQTGVVTVIVYWNIVYRMKMSNPYLILANILVEAY